MSAVDLFGLLVPVTYLAMLGIEALFPAREFPAIPYWRLKGFAFLTVQGLLATLTPLLIPKTAGYKIDGESARQSRRDRPVEESPSSAEQGAG